MHSGETHLQIDESFQGLHNSNTSHAAMQPQRCSNTHHMLLPHFTIYSVVVIVVQENRRIEDVLIESNCFFA